ncbi:hypothetical protein BAU18_001408 [Enterococcus diestrammenae]|uniref:Uncharacterized protein n=1 Tax=Enterococcus diestrammenae TaxID=1155073 RepID=A0ABV0F3H8_9ENTE|nr:hypothetical protein BAU18_10190 [Enterococcus diestrammenae]
MKQAWPAYLLIGEVATICFGLFPNCELPGSPKETSGYGLKKTVDSKKAASIWIQTLTAFS